MSKKEIIKWHVNFIFVDYEQFNEVYNTLQRLIRNKTIVCDNCGTKGNLIIINDYYNSNYMMSRVFCLKCRESVRIINYKKEIEEELK
jgi:hypothetical protein